MSSLDIPKRNSKQMLVFQGPTVLACPCNFSIEFQIHSTNPRELVEKYSANFRKAVLQKLCWLTDIFKLTFIISKVTPMATGFLKAVN